MKYKKVAVVENFFDIIYNVHINEGARGIQHAGQKRTHRTVRNCNLFLLTAAKTKINCSEYSSIYMPILWVAYSNVYKVTMVI